MLNILLRTRLEAMLSILTGASRTRKAQSKGKLIGFAALMVMSLFSVGTLFSRIFEVIGPAFSMSGLGWLYFAFAGVMSFALMLIGNIFAAKAQLYEAKDNDLLLSMPIRPIHILLSRLFLLLVLALVLALPVAIPALIYWPGKLSTMGWIAFFAAFFVALPLLNLAVSALLGWLIHLVSARARNKSLITLVFSLAFMSAYMVFSFRMNSMLTKLASDPSGLEKSLGAAAPLVWLGRAVSEGDAAGLGLLLGLALLLFGLCLWLLARTFIQTATVRSTGAKRRYVERTAAGRSPRAALLLHELGRLWAIPAYLLNAGLGCIFLLIAAVALLIKGSALTSMPEWPYIAPFLRPMSIPALGFMAITIYLTAPSISLEGRSLWIPKSLPVSSWDVLQAKLRLHMLLAVPPLLFCSVTAGLVLGCRGALLALVLVLPTLYGVFNGLLGLAENLRHPNFNWTNETQAVKSGAGVLLTMFISMGAVALPVIAYLLLSDKISLELVGFVTAGLLAAGSLLLWLWLRRRGTQLFEEL